jgi:hypothetical protein
MVEFPLSAFVIMALASDNFHFIWFIIFIHYVYVSVLRCVACIVFVGCVPLDALCVPVRGWGGLLWQLLFLGLG